MKRAVVLGLDVGSSSLKYSLFGTDGGVALGSGRVDYVEPAHDGRRPAIVYKRAVHAVLDALRADFHLEAVGIATQMYSIIEVQDDTPIVHQWNSQWLQGAGRHTPLISIDPALFSPSGCPDSPLFPARKLASLAPRERARFRPYGVKEYLIHGLTGTLATDYSTASSSGLVDIAAGEWNEALIRELGFRLAQMPALGAHNEAVGRIGGAASGAERATVAPALGDGVSASLACRGISPACANLGTSTAVRRIASSLPAVEDDVFWCFRFDRDCFVYGAISANGCAVIDWAQEVLAPQRNGSLPSSDTPLTADQSLPLFLPWVNGELFPYWSDSPRGILWGITAGLGAEALKIAVQQGVAFTVARMIEQVCSQSPEIGNVVVGGGGVLNCQLLTTIGSVSGVNLLVLDDSEWLVANGAALSAAQAIDCTLSVAQRAQPVEVPFDDRLRERYERWCFLSDRLQQEL